MNSYATDLLSVRNLSKIYSKTRLKNFSLYIFRGKCLWVCSGGFSEGGGDNFSRGIRGISGETSKVVVLISVHTYKSLRPADMI